MVHSNSNIFDYIKSMFSFRNFRNNFQDNFTNNYRLVNTCLNCSLCKNYWYLMCIINIRDDKKDIMYQNLYNILWDKFININLLINMLRFSMLNNYFSQYMFNNFVGCKLHIYMISYFTNIHQQGNLTDRNSLAINITADCKTSSYFPKAHRMYNNYYGNFRICQWFNFQKSYQDKLINNNYYEDIVIFNMQYNYSKNFHCIDNNLNDNLHKSLCLYQDNKDLGINTNKIN